jgi:hypothetical protein
VTAPSNQRVGGILPLCLQRIGAYGHEITVAFCGTLPETAVGEVR